MDATDHILIPVLRGFFQLSNTTHDFIVVNHNMDAPTRLHKITAFSQLLTNLLTKAEAMEASRIKAASEDDLSLLLLNHHPLKLTEMPESWLRSYRSLKSFYQMSRETLKRSMAWT